MDINRRSFLKFAGVAGSAVAAATAGKALASATGVGAGVAAGKGGKSTEFVGMLVDTTKCIGCRSCEEACNQANKLPEPKESFSTESVFERQRDTTPEAFTVVNRYENPKDPGKPIFARKQCMHCNQPGCASACLVRALEKKPEGPIVYNKERCMGCRYCMIACPFDIPKYQYESAAPYVRKCIFCFDRLKAGEKPACADACPEGATLFGSRRDLLEEARRRIYTEPEKYHNKIYGEHEVGGTGWLYLSSVPFEKIGMKTNLDNTPLPEHTSGFLFGVPHVFVLWPTLLAGLAYMTKDKGSDDKGGGNGHE
jgi:Fe-S-cluster-containing dehydrogenase component